LKSIREATNSFIRLEKDLVTFLPIEPMPAFELQQDFCWLQDASQNLEDLYKVNCIGPNQLLESYKKFEDVINTDKK
jgi:hypothetical protein